MKRFHTMSIAVVLLLAIVAGALTACNTSSSSTEGSLPTIPPTVTARPHMTPTFIPSTANIELPAVDWDQVQHMYPAMRPEYTGDVDQFVETGQRYYIEARLDLGPEAAVVDGAQRVRFTNNFDVVMDEIVYRLYPNLPDMGGQLRISNVTLNGDPVEPVFEVRNTIMSIPVAGGLAPGETVEMSMDFILVVERGINPERFGFEFSQFQAVNWHPTLSVFEGPEKGWWKTRIWPQNNDPYYGEIGLYEIKLTHSENVMVGISGVTTEQVDNGDGTITKYIVTGPMRDNFLLAGTTMGKITDEIDGIVVNVYFLPGGERGAEWVMEVSLRTLEVFNRIFGDYPYSELDIAQTEIAAGGVEYPGIVVVDRNLWDNGSPTTELITAHEIGHQWWYAMVGNNQGEVPWIDESITSYAEGIYLRETYEDDEERYTDWLQSQRNSFNFFLGSGAENLTMNRSTIEFPPFQVGILIYTKGRIFYSELEEMVGRDVFYQALHNYFLDMKYEITSAYDIMRHFEEASGQDLDAFFYEWVGDFEGLDPAVKDDADPSDDLSTEEETLPMFKFGG